MPCFLYVCVEPSCENKNVEHERFCKYEKKYKQCCSLCSGSLEAIITSHGTTPTQWGSWRRGLKSEQ